MENDYTTFAELVYTPVEEAVEQMRYRQAAGLFDEIEQNGLIDIPPILRGRPVALLGRQIGTPNHETQRFLELASRYNLFPVIWEYHADRFLTRNAVKRSWGKMGFFRGAGRNGGLKVNYLNVVDFNQADGVRLRDIRTSWGQPFIEFHHALLHSHFEDVLTPGNLYDASDWFAACGGVARKYYPAFISLFLRHAIWFETFLLEGEELAFTREVFLPAFFEVYSAFGVKPLIVRLDPEREEGSPYWHLYPDALSHALTPWTTMSRRA